MTLILFPFIAAFGILWYTGKLLVWVGRVIVRIVRMGKASKKRSRQRKFDASMAPLVKEYRRV